LFAQFPCSQVHLEGTETDNSRLGIGFHRQTPVLPKV
jgi:hypothetical protein